MATTMVICIFLAASCTGRSAGNSTTPVIGTWLREDQGTAAADYSAAAISHPVGSTRRSGKGGVGQNSGKVMVANPHLPTRADFFPAERDFSAVPGSLGFPGKRQRGLVSANIDALINIYYQQLVGQSGDASEPK